MTVCLYLTVVASFCDGSVSYSASHPWMERALWGWAAFGKPSVMHIKFGSARVVSHFCLLIGVVLALIIRHFMGRRTPSPFLTPLAFQLSYFWKLECSANCQTNYKFWRAGPLLQLSRALRIFCMICSASLLICSWPFLISLCSQAPILLQKLPHLGHHIIITGKYCRSDQDAIDRNRWNIA